MNTEHQGDIPQDKPLPLGDIGTKKTYCGLENVINLIFRIKILTQI